jgi:hypothetical protein
MAMKDKKGKQADLFANQCTCGRKYEECDRPNHLCPTFKEYQRMGEARWAQLLEGDPIIRVSPARSTTSTPH